MPVQVGVHAFVTDRTVDVVSLARETELRGLQSLWLSEHSHMPVASRHPATDEGRIPESYRRLLDPYIALAAAAIATSTLRLGTAVGLPAERHPIQLAKQIATLDHISAGRFEFGVGYGWNTPEMRNLGVDVPRRRAMIKEKFRAMAVLWTEEVAAFSGEFVTFTECWAWPKPTQQPRPPVLVGGPAAGWVFDDIAEFGDGWLPFFPVDAAVLAKSVARLRERFAARSRAGERPQVTALGLEAGVRSRSADEFAASLPSRAALEDLAAAGLDRLVLTLPVASRDLALKALDLVAGLRS